MSSDNLLSSLRRGPPKTSGTSQKYGGNYKNAAGRNTKSPVSQQAPGQVVKYQRTSDGDRPAAGPELITQDGQGEMRRDDVTLGDIVIDLSLRAVEMMIAAAAQEVVYYFSKRRFFGRKDRSE